MIEDVVMPVYRHCNNDITHSGHASFAFDEQFYFIDPFLGVCHLNDYL